MMAGDASVPEILEHDIRSRSLQQRLDEARRHELLYLVTGDVLVAPGTRKDFFFWIVSGQLKLRWPGVRGAADQIELLGAGEYFGLGFLGHHIAGAIAVTDATLQVLPNAAAAGIARIDATLKLREAVETRREFVHRRESLTAAATQPLVQRLAAFLSYLSRCNSYEGRDPLVIGDEITCQVVSDYLGAEIEALAQALKQLCDLGAVEILEESGLRIRDPEFLDYIAGCKEHVLAEA